MTNIDTNPSRIAESFSGLDHLFEVVPRTEPVSFEMESLQRLLAVETLYHGDLSALIYEIGGLGKMSEEWKTVFEQAYEKIPLNKRIHARDSMMYLYLAFDDYETAAKFLPLKPYTTHEITVAMQVWLRLKRFHEAEAVVQLCRERLPANEGWEDELPLRKAMESYYIATEKWDEAAAVWNSAKLSCWVNPFLQVAQLHALHALVRVRDGLRVISEFQRQERARHKVTRGKLSFIKEKKALKRTEKMLMRMVSPEQFKLLTGRKDLPVHDPHASPCHPRVLLANLIMSLEAEQRKRFGEVGPPEAANSGEN